MPKKSGKFGKMSEEEKLIYLEQQRMADEQEKKNKEEMMSQFLRNKLEKEEKMASHNLNKINYQWRIILRETKSHELKKEIEILSQTFERMLDRKESLLKSLQSDLLEAEEQYAMASRSHLENIDKLIELQRKRLEEMQEEFQEEKDLIIEDFELEKQSLKEQHEREMREMEDVIFGMEEIFREKEAERLAEFESTRDEIKNKNLEDMHSMRVQLETMLEEFYNQFETTQLNYIDATNDRRKLYEELLVKDQISSTEIEEQTKKIQKLNKDITKVKVEIGGSNREWEGRIETIKEEKDLLAKSFNILKKQVHESMNKEKLKLIKFSVIIKDTLKELKEKYLKGEKLIKAAERCRKLESQEEKVMPFYNNKSLDKEVSDIQNKILIETNPQLTVVNSQSIVSSDSITDKQALFKVMDDYSDMENFWKRYNKVFIEKSALEKENSQLEKQNQILRQHLKKYFEGVKIGEEINNYTNKGYGKEELKINIRPNSKSCL